MGKYKTKYSSEWERTFDWIMKCTGDASSAACKICKTSFKIDGSGLSQVRSHSKSYKHKNAMTVLNGQSSQSILVPGNTTGTIALSKGRLLLTKDDETLRAEILWAVKCVKSNFSFASNDDNNDLFKDMFPDSAIAASYKMAHTKCKYMVQFGIYEWIMEVFLADFKEKPFIFKFDETTTSQVKTQYDAYVQYDSKHFGKIVSRYAGSLFFGHCCAFHEFGKKLSWDVQYLLQIGRDGPNVNKSFIELLKKDLKENHGKSIIEIGSCALHVVHNGFQNGLEELNFDFNGFAHDLWFFFKNSSARREDYNLIELVTEVETDVMFKNAPTRWLYLKKVSLRIVNQWENLKVYFLDFLPKQKNFRKKIETTRRYQTIRNYLVSKTSLIYLGFVIHIADILDGFLTLFQSSKPIVHVLYPSIGDLLYQLMANFVKSNVLINLNKSKKEASELGVVDLAEKRNLKSVHEMDFGKTAMRHIGLLENNTKFDIIKTEFKKCYIELTSYLQQKLPHRYSLLANLQYLHPKNRNDDKAVPAIRRVAEAFTKVLKGANITNNLSSDRYIDLIVNQFRMYQTETLEDMTSYLHWCKVEEMRNVQGEFKYQELGQFAKTCLSLSHANGDPERGFSINKNVLQDRLSLEESTIVAIRMVKDSIILYPERFPINRRILELCANARRKYFLYLDQQALEKELTLKQQRSADDKVKEKQKNKNHVETVTEIDKSIEIEGSKLNTAESLIEDGTKIMSQLINSRGKVDKQELLKAQMLVQAGAEKVSIINSNVKDLQHKKSEILLKRTPKK